MNKILLNFFWLFLSFFLTFNACNSIFEDKGLGQLRLRFSSKYELLTRGTEVPDTNDFILKVTSSSGKVIYEGLWGNSPEAFNLSSGSYTIKVISETFTKPEFSKPQYGDEQVLVVPASGVVNGEINCTQMNSGVRLSINSNFLTTYPSAALLLKSSKGSLMYSYREKKIAYFEPGSVSLILTQDGKDETLLTRVLAPREVLHLNISASEKTSQTSQKGLRIEVDTSRYWINENYVIGSGSSSSQGQSPEDAYTVAAAKQRIGDKGIWVSGFIVGGDLTSTAASFDPPFKSRTNLLFAPRAGSCERSSCIAVSLPIGDVREALNLVDNPNLLGKQVYIKGDIVESYFGLVGLKNVSDYQKK